MKEVMVLAVVVVVLDATIIVVYLKAMKRLFELENKKHDHPEGVATYIHSHLSPKTIDCAICGCMVRKEKVVRGKPEIVEEYYSDISHSWRILSKDSNRSFLRFDEIRSTVVFKHYCLKCAPSQNKPNETEKGIPGTLSDKETKRQGEVAIGDIFMRSGDLNEIWVCRRISNDNNSILVEIKPINRKGATK